MQPLDLFIIALAAWRFSYLITREDAPFKLMKRLRERHPDWGVFICLYCASMWSALLMLILWHIPYAQYGVMVFALSGAGLMLASYSGVNHPPQSE